MRIFFLALILLLFPAQIHAQELTYEKAYQDYLFAQEEYSREHGEYLLARSQYQQAGTLAAETKAREETSQMLAARDEVIRTYIQAVRLRLLETEGVTDTVRSTLSSRLETDVNWYRDHRDRVSSAGTLNDLVADSEEAKKHFDENTTPLVYEALVVIPVTRVAELRKDISTIVNDVKEFVNVVEAQGSHDVSNADRWMIQIDGKVNRSLDKELQAQNQLLSLQNPKNFKTNFGGVYNTAITYVTESHQFLKEASTFLSEVMRLIRTKN